MGLLRNTQLPDTLEHAVIARTAAGDGPGESSLANKPSVTLANWRANPSSFLIRTSAQACMTISSADATLRPFDAEDPQEVGRQ